MAGEHLYDSPLSNGSDYLELLIGTHSDNGYTTTCYPTTYNFTKLYEENGNWSGSLLKQAINAGTSYVHHDGHANSGYVAGWYSINNSDFSGANGTTHNYTFFHSQGCDCGAFDENCILEKMVKIQNFAVAVIGNSRYGWFNEGQTEGPGCHLEREMTDAQWADRIGLLGNAISEGKTMTAPWVTAPGQWEEGALRWNFYDMNVLGDGAVNVWLDEPFTATVNCPAQVVIGSPSMDVTITDPDGTPLKNYRCLVYMDGEVIAMGLTDENGLAQIAFDGGLASVGEMVMKVTGVNSYPQNVEIMAVPSGTPYDVYESHTLVGGEQIEFDGSYAFNMVLNNVGSVNASNLTATLTCDSEYITIQQPNATIGNLDGNQSITIEEVFGFTVSDDVPNNTSVRFNLSCTDGTDTWERHFDTKVYAPEFEMTRISIEPATGNTLNPGDQGTIRFSIHNSGGATAPSALFEVFNSHPEITLDEHQWQYDDMAPNETVIAEMHFTLSDNAQVVVMYELPYAVYYGHYILQDSYFLSVGQSMDGFETGDFSAFDWHNGSIVTAWTVTSQNPYAGQYCAKSSNIGHSETSVLYLDVTVGLDCEISFMYKVSSEANYDKLFFKVDDVEKGNWSGEIPWTRASYTLTAGTHRLKWEYTKDTSVSSGDDCAWIDNVVLPPAQVISLTNEATVNIPALFPNPNNGSFSINLPEEDCTINVYNSLGQLVYRQENANGPTTLHIEGLNKGVYYVNIQSTSGTSTQKFVKQ